MSLRILDAQKHRTLRSGVSFPLRNRLYRSVWKFTWMLFAAWTPAILHPWRRTLLRAFGANVGQSVAIYGSARVWYPPNLSLGAEAVIGPHVNIYCIAGVSVGDRAIISQGAHLCTGTHDIDDIHFQLQALPIVVGRNAWVAAEAFIGPGVSLGEGAVLGARSVSFSDLAPWGIYVGNPARKIRDRNHAEISARSQQQ